MVQCIHYFLPIHLGYEMISRLVGTQHLRHTAFKHKFELTFTSVLYKTALVVYCRVTRITDVIIEMHSFLGKVSKVIQTKFFIEQCLAY